MKTVVSNTFGTNSKMHYCRPVPIVVLTAMSRVFDDSVDLRDGKVDDYINKPFRPKTLIDSVNKVLNLETAEV